MTTHRTAKKITPDWIKKGDVITPASTRLEITIKAFDCYDVIRNIPEIKISALALPYAKKN